MVQDADIFENPRPPRLIVGTSQDMHEEERESHLDSIIGCYKEEFPALSDIEDEPNEPA